MNFYLTTLDKDDLPISACKYIDFLHIRETYLIKSPDALTSIYMDYHLNAYLQVVLFRSISLFKKENYVYRLPFIDDDTADRIFGIISTKYTGKFDSYSII